MGINFVQLEVDKGDVREGAKVSHNFTKISDREIKSVKPLCDCMTYRNSGSNHLFWFTTKPVPGDLIAYNTTKYIVVSYVDDTQDILTISARVIKP